MEPASPAIGAYRLVKLLGQGGMGSVYQAEHKKSGKIVALKTIRCVDEMFLENIRLEIRALARINHPNIVQIIDQGIDNGLPWYAMELFSGQTLGQYFSLHEDTHISQKQTATTDVGEFTSQHFENAPGEAGMWWTCSLIGRGEDQGQLPLTAPTAALNEKNVAPVQQSESIPTRTNPSDLKDVATIIIRLCAPLAFLHGQGLVHRDLKPDNVFITDDGIPILMDFGLMTRFADDFGRETLRIEKGGVGTVKYMAPEQISGQLVDARADLYSLGCIIYELLAGCPPFRGRTTQVISAHLHQKPLPVTQFSSSIPAEIDNLLRQLLAKDPRDRIGHADVVAAVLAETLGPQKTTCSIPKPRTFLYRPGFVGRQTALNRIDAFYEKLKDKQSGLFFISGEGGVGKTRLIMEGGRKLAHQGVKVMTGVCSEQVSKPLAALQNPLRMIADRCRQRGQEETDFLLGGRGKLLARYQPALLDLPGQESYPDPEELPWQAAKIRLFHSLSETFCQLARKNTLLLILDDLHFADELLLDFFDFELRTERFKGFPILIIGAFRTEIADQKLLDIIEKYGVEQFTLSGFDQQMVAVIVSDMLAMHPAPDQFCQFLGRHSNGNPLFIAEYLRAAVEDNLLFRDEWGSWQLKFEHDVVMESFSAYEQIPLPTSIQEIVECRLNRLTDTERAVIQTAAVMGQKLHVELLKMTSGLPGDTVDDVLEKLIQKQIFEKKAGLTIDFINSQVREAAYKRLKPDQCVALHLLVAESMETLFAAERQYFWAALGYHWQKGENIEKARACFLAGAREAIKRFAHSEAEKLYQSYLKLLKKPSSDMIEVKNELGKEVFQMQGRIEDARQQFQAALEIAQEIGDRLNEARALICLGGIKILTGQPDQAQELNERALAIAHQLENQSIVGSCLINLARIKQEQGQLESSRLLFEEALGLSKSEGERRNELSCLRNLAIILHIQGHYEQARTQFEQALDLAREEGSKIEVGQCLGNLGNHYYTQGTIEKARDFMEQAMAIFREIGDKENEGTCLGNLANLHLDQKQLEKANKLSKQALTIFRDFGDARSESIWLGNIALISSSQGAFEKAHLLYDQAITIARQVKDRANEGVCLGNRGNLYLTQSLPEEAEIHLTEALDIARQIGDRQRQGLWLFKLALLHYSQGQLEQTLQFYERSLQIYQESEDKYHECKCLNAIACLYCEMKQLRKAAKFHEQACYLAGKIKSLYLQGDIKLDFAIIKRRTGQNIDPLKAQVEECRSIFSRSSDLFSVFRCWCEQGHLALAANQSANNFIARAQQIYDQIIVDKSIQLQKAMKGLCDAQQAFNEGDLRPLVHGEIRENLPLSLRS
ncbi:tetratricopeptide repeat protein [candidate division CSSED10-310 bacterium]|uniref:Tetratricopeptide repeat protein n=1 Tax=candidate division CSSED10-310 bacterium TaxID=2855610 RepID=A0ABV6YT86_UNCC1